MSARLITYRPGSAGPDALARLVWQSSTALLAAARAGRRDLAGSLGLWLDNTRRDPRCTPPLARVIDGSLCAARRHLGGGTADFTPLQPDDGAAA